ncbi:carboxyl-terminal processing protease [Clostridium tetanomorphum]|uniref:S41 family peptidase n=1 Tax=Clostridium tetanomorphum TaxID=1553 RepID=A0A923E6S8_CLOTT|nr:S41 family peptidase [Clostridium tetanomorphum]KAJ53209.1 carboxyl-terminal protease [Clostridium tetanomorphum DSM 665]MBC2397515.1 S41 family peptidase [Clostridium tetanomorphum]MBP1863611.1 carboxyl-terminal processing protease [Clostridium tetanomorphum]NRS86187.1 carboxyl-terminal processing protease [Clostridium tetanomorphum]NRZ95734.1 carboxyl-terminal processing protease [Clostridium tetanomorphum]
MNKKKWIGWTIAVVLITNIITFVGSSFISLSIPNGKVIISRDDYNRVLEFSKLFGIKEILEAKYDGKIDNAALEEGAIKGMTAALNDPYTTFMDKQEFQEFNAQTEGNYSGVGLQVQAKEKKILIVDIFEDSPAKKAGILPKDEIEKVDGKAVSGKELDKAVAMMKGPEGTNVTLTLYREGKGNFDVTLKRSKINLVTIKGEMLNNNIGLIQIAMFDENGGKNLKKELERLKGKGMQSLIIDLRGNPGGLLDECVDMVSNFIPKGKVIVSTIDKYKSEKKYKSKGGNYIGLPLVVLTNEGSASASEIFSGAIRDYKAGTLVGEKTFGKGVVQTLIDTGEGTALKVTISKYYTPNGENIHKIGIKPDVEVKYPEELLKKPYKRETDPQFNKALEILQKK